MTEVTLPQGDQLEQVARMPEQERVTVLTLVRFRSDVPEATRVGHLERRQRELAEVGGQVLLSGLPGAPIIGPIDEEWHRLEIDVRPTRAEPPSTPDGSAIVHRTLSIEVDGSWTR